MNETEKKQKIIRLVNKLDINQEYKDIIISKIDFIDTDKLLEVISKYANNLDKIEKQNKKVNLELDKMISKYKNNSEEYFENRDGLKDIENLINNI